MTFCHRMKPLKVFQDKIELLQGMAGRNRHSEVRWGCLEAYEYVCMFGMHLNISYTHLASRVDRFAFATQVRNNALHKVRR